MSALADLLESRQDDLVQRWTLSVESELAVAAPASRAELRNHVPSYIAALINVLRNGASGEFSVGTSARGHGRQRYRLGFDIDSLVREYSLLNARIFDLIEEAVCPATLGELRVLTDFIAAGVADAVKEHGRQRQKSELETAKANRAREAWSATTLQSIGDAVIATDPLGNITFLNSSAESLTGWSQTSALGKPLPEVFRILQEGTRATVASPVERVLHEGHVIGLGNHTLLLRRDGFELPIDDSAAPIRDDQGQLIGVVLVFRDVTEKKRADKAINELLTREKTARAEAELERQKLHSVFIQSAAAICMFEGREHTFTFANPAYRQLVGGRDVVGKPLLEALPELRGQGFDTLLDTVMATGEPYFGRETPIKLAHHREDEALILNFVYSPKRNVAGAIDGVLVTAIDITEQVDARLRAQALADQLRVSEERLRRVVDASGAGTWELEIASDRVSADAQHRALLGVPADTALTVRTWLDATFADDRPRVAAAFAAALRGEDEGRLSVEQRAGDDSDGGTARWIELRGQVLRDDGGQPARLVGTSVDVSARKHAERALADERDKLQTIFRESPAAMALWTGRELTFEMLNPQYQAIFRDRELKGKPLEEAVPELAAQTFPDQLRRVLATGEPLVGRETLVRLAPRANGPLEDRFYDFTYVRINDSNGKPYGVYDHAIDVTDRVLARRALEASQERLQLALNGARQGSWTIQWPSRILVTDERFRSMHGVAENETIDTAIERQVHPEDRGRIHSMLQQALRNGFPYVCEYRVLQRDESYRWIFARGEPKYDGAGAPLSMSGVAFDINERKEAEAEIMRSRAVEQQLRQEAEEANRSKDEFLAMLGHEMRNPLAPITTAIQLMKLRGDDAFARERTTIERQVEHLTRLVDDLLDVSRITRGKIEISGERVNLAAVVASAIEMASPLLEQRQHHLTVHVPAHGLIVDGDPRRLAQIVSNLLTNAANYTEPNGRVELTAARDGDDVVLRVSDNGIGIAPEMLPRVFDLFVQEGQSLERARGGLGLGLAIVRTLVGLHGGTVLAESGGRGRGSTFTIRLPAAKQPTAAATKDAAAAAPATVPPNDREAGGRRVLIVDDNIDAAELLATALELLGHETRVAHDGPSALKLMESFAPEFAVLDIGLPVMDGYELAQRMRGLPALRGTRIVALTGYGQASDHQRSEEAGFDAHLVKPVQLAQLEAMIVAD
ncbi:MAG TPA: PAS domain-containing protein [Polyangia bacterium]|jgi:PAS domain S-box-containing protein|nr:PAS domain-containing protein [Polyangia bacterium]